MRKLISGSYQGWKVTPLPSINADNEEAISMKTHKTYQSNYAGNGDTKRYIPARSIFGITALTLAVGGAAHSFAQTRSTALEEIVVTASRREEGLQSIPASISAVTGAELERQGITSFR